MCNIKNFHNTLIQTVVGLVMYAYGLRDAGFDLLNKLGMSCRINRRKYVRLMSCVYLEKNRKLFSHIARSPVELHEMFITCGSKLNDDLKSSTQWLSYDVLNCDMTDLNQWLKFTQRVCYFCNHRSKNLFQLTLPEISALKYH